MTIATIAARMDAERAAAPKLYAELLDPNRPPQPDDIEKLNHLAGTLGLSAAQVQKHLQVREQAAQLGDLEAEQKRLEAEHQRAFEPLQAFDEETKRLMTEREEAREPLDDEMRRVKVALHTLSSRRSARDTMLMNHPLAFGIVREQPQTFSA